MKRYRLFGLWVFFALFTAHTLPFSPAAVKAASITNTQDTLFGDCNSSRFLKVDSESSNKNITKLTNRSNANFLLNWAEHLYPELFPPGPLTEYVAHLDCFLRQYPNRLLGTYQDHVYMVDPQSQLIDFGAVDYWLPIAQDPKAGSVLFGYVYSSISLDREPGTGDCGTGAWADPNCISIKIWWKLQLQAFASSPVLIIPDGTDRWVITNLGSVAQKYGVSLPDASTLGTYQSMTLDPSVTNPECIVSKFEGADFSFQVMGTRENGLTELIISSNPVESTQGTCMQAAFAYDTTWLLNGWAAALSGDATDLRIQLNDTFKDSPGQYTFINTVNTNPSPNNRDRVRVELGFLCTSSTGEGGLQIVPCPWE